MYYIKFAVLFLFLILTSCSSDSDDDNNEVNQAILDEVTGGIRGN